MVLVSLRSMAVLWLILCALLLTCGAQSSGSQDKSSDKKASSVKKNSKPAAKSKETDKKSESSSKSEADKPAEKAADPEFDIPLLAGDELETSDAGKAADLNSGVTAKRSLTANSAEDKGKDAAGAGAIAVDGSSPLKRSRGNSKPSAERASESAGAVAVDNGEAVDVQVGPAASGFRSGGGNNPAPVKAAAANAPASAPVKNNAAAKDNAPVKTAPASKSAATDKPARPKPAAKPAAAAPLKPAPAEQKAARPVPQAAGAASAARTDEPSLREYFDESETPVTEEAAEALPDDETMVQDEAEAEPAPLLIASAAGGGAGAALPPSGAADKAPGLFESAGRDVPQVNPWQSILSLLAVLTIFLALAKLYQRFRLGNNGGAQKTLSVIETIGLGPGRQIVIVEMHNDALVLGMTPHSINLLDKVPMQALDGSYRNTVDEIIGREASQPQRWAERPAFRMELGGAIGMPRLSGMQAGHGQSLTVAQMRQARASSGVALHNVLPGDDHSTKTELIERIRQQLRSLED